MTEAELLAHVLEAAAELGVLAYHPNDSRRDRRGFPDLVLAGSRVELWELKSATGSLSEDQLEWYRRINSTGTPCRVIRPDMWPGEIKTLLRIIRGA
jgi:hypothetical protein